jgi:hypothetical protein
LAQTRKHGVVTVHIWCFVPGIDAYSSRHTFLLYLDRLSLSRTPPSFVPHAKFFC